MAHTVPVDYDIVGSYNNETYSNIDAERSINCFEYYDPLGKKPKALINTSGLMDSQVIFGNAAGGFRAQFFFMGYLYNVIGNSVYRLSPTLTFTFLGNTVNTSSGYVGIDANTYQVGFVDGVNGYIWDINQSTFTMITDTSFPSQPLDITQLDGFFIVPQGGTNAFQLCMINQGLVWGESSETFTASSVTNLLTMSSTANFQTGVPVQFSNTGGALPTPLDNTDTYYCIYVSSTTIKIASSYANAIAGTAIVITMDGSGTNTITGLGQLQQGAVTSHPGTIVACRCLHRRLFLFSQFFTEVWENAGIGSNLPLRRNNSLLIEYGTPAIGSIAVGFDRLFFLSQSRDGLGPVMMIGGTQALPVSPPSLDDQLATYAQNNQVADCRAFLIKEGKIIFYRMNFTAANHTFVYNVSQSVPQSGPDAVKSLFWHEEEVLNGDRHPAQTHAYFNGQNYAGDYAKPTMYQVSRTAYTNDGEVIRRCRIGRAQGPAGYQRRRIDRLQIDLIQGTIEQLGLNQAPLPILTENNFDLLTENGLILETENGVLMVNPIQPFLYLSISKDGGNSYKYVDQATMGSYGQRTFRTLWRKLGVIPRGQYFVPKIEFFEPIPFVILGAAWAFEDLPE